MPQKVFVKLLALVPAYSALLGGPVVVACESGTAPRSGQPSPTPARTDRTSVTRIEVSAHGFRPSTVVLDHGRTLAFRRTTDATCATAVVFPGLGIQKGLPLDTDIVVELPASAHGEVGFQCGMGMYKSKVVVQ